MNASNCFQSHSLFFPICSTSPPGGNQVDGLPPASSWVSHDLIFLENKRALAYSLGKLAVISTFQEFSERRPVY